MNPNIKILVACHKEVPAVKDNDIYMPIHVGKALHPEISLGIPGDDTGDNISLKNTTFCELTALYWAWKNLKNVDYIGLCHYRRYFNFLDIDPFNLDSFFDSNTDTDNLEKRKILKFLQQGKIIIPKREHFHLNLYEYYSENHNEEDLSKIYDIICRRTDATQYKEAFEQVMNQNKMALCNMFVMPWQTFCEFCEFIFPTLFQLEKEIDISQYDNYQKRIYGFLSERLFNVFINQKNKNFKVKEVEILNTENPVKHNIFHYSLLSKQNRKYYFKNHRKFQGRE